MAIAIQVLDHRHARFLGNPLDQPLAAARHDHIDVFGHGDQMADGRTVAGGVRTLVVPGSHAVKAQADPYFETTKKGVEEMVNKAQASVDERIARRDALEDETKDLEARVEKAKAYIAKIKE
jgi:hypothetical protein